MVVFKDGSVRSFHDDEKAAYDAGPLREFGAGTGYVIAPVSENAHYPGDGRRAVWALFPTRGDIAASIWTRTERSQGTRWSFWGQLRT